MVARCFGASFLPDQSFCRVQLVVQPLASRLSQPKHYTKFVFLPTGCQINCYVYHKLFHPFLIVFTIFVFVVSFPALRSSCQALLNHGTFLASVYRLAHYDNGIFAAGISSRSSRFTLGLSIRTIFGRLLLDSQAGSRRRLICRGTRRRQTA